jgi:hypothetical protein
MKLRRTKEHVEEVIEMTKSHFEASKECNGFLEEARRILNRRRGFAYLTFGDGQFVLAFWWGTAGPTFCVLVEARQKELVDEELKGWLEKAKGRFSQFFKFQVRIPRDRELAIKELASALSFREVSPL